MRWTGVLAGLLTLVLLASCAPKPPEWTLGKSALYPEQAYLVGVGMASTRAEAENRARSELAKIFTVHIASREVSTESEWLNRAGNVAGAGYRQAIQADLVATSDKVLSGVHIAEVWQNEKAGTWHALAVLDRLKASQALRAEMNEADQSAMTQVRQAEQASTRFRALGHYLQALKALELRSALAADLRIADPSGWVAEPPYSPAVIAAKADEVAGTIQVGIDLQDDRDGIVRGAVIQSLTGLGIQLAPSIAGDVRLLGHVSVDAYKASDPWHWVAAAAQVEFVEPDGRILDAVRVNVREGSQIASRADTLAREKLGEKLAQILIERLGFIGTSSSR